jgi:hypothetical protein
MAFVKGAKIIEAVGPSYLKLRHKIHTLIDSWGVDSSHA